MRGWVTDLELRQAAGLSHEVAYSKVLDVAQKLMAEGWDVTLRPTLPDEPLATAEELRRFMEETDDDT